MDKSSVGQMLMFMHNPIDERFKSVRGAVSCDTAFRVSLYAHRDVRLREVSLVLTLDGGEKCRYKMLKTAVDNLGYEIFDCTLTLHKGLYWYYFEVDNGNVTLPLQRGENIHPRLCIDSPRCYQLSVYEQQYANPDWLSKGVMYHIFVDRFSSSLPLLKDGQCLGTWGQTPKYRDADGEVRCSEIFGGNLRGICEKLDYIASLGVTTLYLSPIFESPSNHKYDTADYTRIDSNFGSWEDFLYLTQQAHARKMRIILDGVFNHSGADSVYFDIYGKYGNGAYNNPTSPYYDWYTFRDDGSYNCWWGIKTLPAYNAHSASLRDYFACKDGIVAKYLQYVDGWRLDVVDELGDDFLDAIVSCAKSTRKDCAIIGEVWEDATCKISYGVRRRYFEGAQLDGVMNYCVKDAIISFVRYGNSNALRQVMFDTINNYPKYALANLMNLLDSHDTPRALTALYDKCADGLSIESLAGRHLWGEDYFRARELLKMSAVLQYTLVGFPSLFYGDEAGLSGYGDPYCRACFPWNNADAELTDFYRTLGSIRKQRVLCENGDFFERIAQDNVYSFTRELEGDKLYIGVTKVAFTFDLDGEYIDLLTNTKYRNQRVCQPMTAFVMQKC